ncbi:MAG TPA: zf-HC2 domain-containing protein [Polyangia bacterium]
MKTVGTTEATTSELHPEEMLTAARAGTLDPRARRDLMAHLSRCSACRLELELANDIVAEGAPKGRGDTALLSDMVQRSLAEASAGSTYRERRSGFGRSSAVMLRRMVLPAVCLLLGGSVATAMWSVRRDALRGPTIEQLPVHEPVRAHARTTPRAPAPYLAPLTVEEEEDLAPPPAPEAPAPLPPPARNHVRRLHHHPVAVAMAAPASTVSAGDIFADANRARRSGDYAAALVEYRKLSTQFPGSREEITGRMIVAELAMGRHAPEEALHQFDSYLAASPNGTLAEEARVGRAEALQTLGRSADERAAWQELLRKHPASVHAPRARERLSQLR